MADFGPFARVMSSGMTGSQKTDAFVKIQVRGIRELVKQLQEFTSVLNSDEVLFNAVNSGAEIIRDDYKRRAQIHMATGNLAKSVRIKKKRYENGGGDVSVVAIVGPQQTGNSRASASDGSGNAAWLVEFGSGPRRPGTNGRRQYINIHQKINGRMGPMRKTTRMSDEDFEKANKGYYFLMGSLRERANQPVGKPGYSRDFADGPGPRQHPITLKPGETLAPMPALGLMQETIANQRTNVYNAIVRVLRNAVSAYAA